MEEFGSDEIIQFNHIDTAIKIVIEKCYWISRTDITALGIFLASLLMVFIRNFLGTVVGFKVGLISKF